MAHKKCVFLNVSANLSCMSQTCPKELVILLKCREAFEKFLAACSSSKNTGLSRFFSFSKFSDILYFKNTSFLTKTKRCLLCSLLWTQNYHMSGKYLTSKTTFSKKENIQCRHIGEDLEFIILAFSWCVLLDLKSIVNVKKNI